MFISNAFGSVAPAPQGGGIWIFRHVALAAVFIFVLRPQSKRQGHKAMTEALQRGDEVVTTGGRVTKVYEQYVVELAENVSDGAKIAIKRAAQGNNQSIRKTRLRLFIKRYQEVAMNYPYGNIC